MEGEREGEVEGRGREAGREGETEREGRGNYKALPLSNFSNWLSSYQQRGPMCPAVQGSMPAVPCSPGPNGHSPCSSSTSSSISHPPGTYTRQSYILRLTVYAILVLSESESEGGDVILVILESCRE